MAFVDLTTDDVDSMTATLKPVRDQHREEGTAVRQNSGADRLPAPTEALQAAHQQVLPALNQRDIRSPLCMPLAPQSSLGTQPKPHMSCVDGQTSLLDHVVMRDILRVLGDSRPHASFSAPSLYASLQLKYLQQISGSQAEQQARLLVYLEWLTQRLFQHGSAEKHERLYATVLEMCKASQVYQHFPANHALSTTKLSVHAFPCHAGTAAECAACSCCLQVVSFEYTASQHPVQQEFAYNAHFSAVNYASRQTAA